MYSLQKRWKYRWRWRRIWRTIKDQTYASCDGQSLWSLNRFEETNRVGFWVRGEINLVNKLIRKNWSNLSSPGGLQLVKLINQLRVY
ncbi:hypothetical protein MSU_0045 [Mycoplasma suis str. Illinois]|uniref:Uncharacterized protein n=1 Tax=Mycoplasma suis (strain Illinois) TaxID=768700 RepID=F0QQ19_MYCSL|nr:hypothetical protein MSU_0045 [Mycoplasma suis str. Illinois]